MTTPLGQLQPGRDKEKELFKLTNELRRFAYPGAGTFWCIASEAMAAFSCTARVPATETVALARADGSNYAVGVLAAAVRIGELAQVVTEGEILGAVSGRTAGDTVWVGTAGTLVFAAPASGYVLPIAVCINATDIYVRPQTPASTLSDSVSFHFYIDETSGGGGFNAGELVPSSQTAITIYGATDIGFIPSGSKVYSRGELLLFIVNNSIAGIATYNIHVTLNGGAIAGASFTFVAGTTGPHVLSFATGSTLATDYYELQVSGNAAVATVTYTAVLRLYT